MISRAVHGLMAAPSRRRDDPHTKSDLEEKISRRPLSMCRTSWPIPDPEAEHATSAVEASCRWSASQPAQPTSQTSTSTTSELGWDRSTTMELFTTDRHQHQPAATMVFVIDTALFRHRCAAQRRWPASSRRAAAAAQRSARRSQAARSSPQASTAVTGGVRASARNGAICPKQSISPPPRIYRRFLKRLALYEP